MVIIRALTFGLIGALAIIFLRDAASRGLGQAFADTGAGLSTLGNVGEGIEGFLSGIGRGGAKLFDPLFTLRDLVFGPQAGAQEAPQAGGAGGTQEGGEIGQPETIAGSGVPTPSIIPNPFLSGRGFLAGPSPPQSPPTTSPSAPTVQAGAGGFGASRGQLGLS